MDSTQQRIKSLFSDPALNRLLDRLRKRMSQGKSLTGKVSLKSATAEERLALATLFGSKPKTRGDSVTVDLDLIAEMLRHAELDDSLESALSVVFGPVKNQAAAAVEKERRWQSLWNGAEERLADNALALNWLAGLKNSGLLKRRSKRSIDVANRLLDSAMSILEKVPVQALRLSELAALETGNSHALDKGQPLSSLVIRYARELDELAKWKSAADRRDAWELLGVVPNELSAPLLVLNLRADNESFTGRVLNLHADNGEPYRLSVRQLKHMTPRFDANVIGPDVYVCENPTVVDVAVHRLGNKSKPLICIDGQPKTASRLLLNLLSETGTTIHYHGDFDWEGLRIANLVMTRHDAKSWRFGTEHYNASVSDKYKLKGKRVNAIWDHALATAMQASGYIIHEEQVLDELISDLALDKSIPLE
ncbi:MAG: TIGR02679 family protein [Pirellulaceae bacterium]